MDLDKAREFARHHHRAVLATRNPQGAVQQSPVLVAVDGEGRFTVSTRETAFKTRNLRRDPRADLCLFTDQFFGDWVFVHGRAEVVSLPEAMEPLVDYFREVGGEHDDWTEYRRSMHQEKRVLVRIHGEHAGPDRQG